MIRRCIENFSATFWSGTKTAVGWQCHGTWRPTYRVRTRGKAPAGQSSSRPETILGLRLELECRVHLIRCTEITGNCGESVWPYLPFRLTQPMRDLDAPRKRSWSRG